MGKLGKVKSAGKNFGRKAVKGAGSIGKLKGRLTGSSRFQTGKKIVSGLSAFGVSAGDAYALVRGTPKKTKAGKIARTARSAGFGAGGKRRRSSVPKTVRKWVSKTVRKRKQQEKIMRKLVRISGVGRMMNKRSGSRGVITRSEALRALRR